MTAWQLTAGPERQFTCGPRVPWKERLRRVCEGTPPGFSFLLLFFPFFVRALILGPLLRVMGNVYVFSRIKVGFSFFYDCVAVGVFAISLLGTEVNGDVPDPALQALPPTCFWRRAECRTIRPPRDGATSFLVRSGSSPAVQGFPGKGSSAGSELGLLLASRFFFSFSFSYVLLF